MHFLAPPSPDMEQKPLKIRQIPETIRYNRDKITRLLYESVKNDEEIDRRISHTFFRYFKNIWEEKGVDFDSPLWVGWKITPKCNMKCEHCWARLSGVEQSIEIMLSTAKKLVDAGVIHITLTGGEPLIRKDFFEILKYLKSKRVFVEIFSNGTLINEKTVTKLTELLDQKSDTIQISIDGATPEVHDRQRRKKGSFLAAIRAINLLKEAKLKVRVNFVATPINVDQIADTYRLANKMGVDIFSVSAVYPAGRGIFWASEMNYFQYLEQLLICNDDKQNYITHFRPFLPIEIFAFADQVLPSNVKIFRIEEGQLYWSINSEGDVYPSIDLYYPDLKGGNIYTMDVKEIQKTLREKVGIRDLRKTACASCPHISLCRGGDLGRVYLKYGHFNERDPWCIKGVD